MFAATIRRPWPLTRTGFLRPTRTTAASTLPCWGARRWILNLRRLRQALAVGRPSSSADTSIGVPGGTVTTGWVIGTGAGAGMGAGVETGAGVCAGVEAGVGVGVGVGDPAVGPSETGRTPQVKPSETVAPW